MDTKEKKDVIISGDIMIINKVIGVALTGKHFLVMGKTPTGDVIAKIFDDGEKNIAHGFYNKLLHEAYLNVDINYKPVMFVGDARFIADGAKIWCKENSFEFEKNIKPPHVVLLIRGN